MSYCCETISKPYIYNCANKALCNYSSENARRRCCVPAFSIQSRQHSSAVCPPIRLHRFCKTLFHSEKFRFFYERGDLPCMIHHTAKGQSLKWFIDNIESLNIDYYLPIFTDGICEKKYPYGFIALQGVLDFLEHASHKIDVQTLSKMILPLKRALYTHDPIIISRVLIVLQKLAPGNDGAIGVALVPYFNQLLPIMNVIKDQNEARLYRSQRKCVGMDDYEQNSANDLIRLIQKTLFILEQYGGPDAFINIKYLIPTYEQQADVKQLTTNQMNTIVQPLTVI